MIKALGLLLLLAAPAYGQATTPPVNVQLVYTIGTLPTCDASLKGRRFVVTDALTPVALATVVAGGAVVVPVYCNGAAWVVG